MNAGGMLGSLGRRLDGVRTRWRTPYSGVWWVGEGVEWVIDWYARELIRQLEASFGLSCRLAPSCRGVRRQVVHFASRNAYFSKGGEGLHPSNRAVLTWFHGSVEDPDPENQRMIRLLPLHASTGDSLRDYLRVRDRLRPTPVTDTLFVSSHLGYTGTESRVDLLKNSHFVDAKVDIFAKYHATQWTRVGEYAIARQLLERP